MELFDFGYYTLKVPKRSFHGLAMADFSTAQFETRNFVLINVEHEISWFPQFDIRFNHLYQWNPNWIELDSNVSFESTILDENIYWRYRFGRKNWNLCNYQNIIRSYIFSYYKTWTLWCRPKFVDTSWRVTKQKSL